MCHLITYTAVYYVHLKLFLNTIVFLNIYNRHSHPWERGMECPLWVRSLTSIMHLWLPFYMKYHVIIDRVLQGANIYPAHVIAIRYVMARNDKPRWRISRCIRKTSHTDIQTFMKIHGTCMKRPMYVIEIYMLLLYVQKLPIYTMKNTMPAHCLYNYNEAAILVHKWWQSKWHRISLVKNKTIV